MIQSWQLIAIIISNIVIVIGAVWKLSQSLAEVKTEVAGINKILALIVQQMESRINSLETRLNNIERKVYGNN